MKKAILITILILVLAAVGWLVDLLWSAGQFKAIAPHFAGQCIQIRGVIGAEDITIHPGTGVTFISACDRRAVAEGQPGKGGIYAYDLNANTPGLVNLTPDASEDFQPHGISLFVGEDGIDTLFVVNHEAGKHQIEIYDLKDEVLVHRKTISDPMLVSPNDLVAVGPERFYVSNDHRFVSGIKRMLEDYLRLGLSNVVYYDGSQFKEAASGFAYANGINVSADGKILYLCATTKRILYIFDRDPATGNLYRREKIKLDTGLDNIEMDKEGGLWIGAHPQLLSFVKHSKDPSSLSPSQILHLTPRSDGGYDIEEAYLNAGDEISGSSVAAVHNDRMLIGSVFEPKLLDCQK
jgi:arylesterase/paraoxonase